MSSGVAPGSPVSAANTNQAFIDANGDDATVGKLGLLNTDPVSGASVTNLQTEVNSNCSYTGKNINSLKDVTPTWIHNDVGSASDTLRDRADGLTLKFNPSTGHKHTGAAGDAPQVSAPDIANTVLTGKYVQGTNLTSGTGSSLSVTIQLTSEIPSSNQFTKGVVVNNPQNYTFLKNTNGDQIEDAFGNEVYGRVTFSGGNWTLSYFSLVTGTETAYTFPSSITIEWFYQKLFNPISDAPVYSDLTNIPSSNATADIVDASETIAGKVALANAGGSDVSGSAGVKGTSTRAAKLNHTHLGVRSVGIYGTALQLFGDMLLEAGNSITLTNTGQRIKIEANGGIGYQEAPAGPVNGVNTTFGPLAHTPSSIESCIVFVDGLPVNKAGWTLTGTSIIFSAPYIPVSGQDVYVWYFASGSPTPPPVVTGTWQTEFRTISPTESSTKIIVLAFTPATPGQVMVDIIGGTAQEFNVDYTIVANEFRWNGYVLDGLLAQGDRLRIGYIA